MNIKDRMEDYLKNLSEADYTSPRFVYYKNKLKSDLVNSVKGLDDPLTGEEIVEYENRLNSFGGKYFDTHLTNVFREFDRYLSSGNFILSVVKLKDILNAKHQCENMLFLKDLEFICKLQDPQVILDLINRLSDDITKLLSETKDSFELCSRLDFYYKILIHALKKPELYDIALSLLSAYFKIKFAILESDKEFFKLPKSSVESSGVSGVTKSSAFSGEKDCDEIKEYLDYYVLKYSLLLQREFLTNLSNYSKFRDELFEEIDSLNTEESIKSLIKISATSSLDVTNDEYSVINVFETYYMFNDVHYLALFSTNTLCEVYRYCNLFIDKFSKQSLIQYSIQLASLSVRSVEMQTIDKNLAFKMSLTSSLDTLIENKVITKLEYDTIINSVKS